MRNVDRETGEIVVSPDNILKQSGEAWQRHRRIVGHRNDAEKTFLKLGEELYWLEEKKQYKTLGHDTFESYLADPEVDISRTVAFRLKGIYETYVKGLKSPAAGLFEAGNMKLDVMRPYVDRENVSEWISKAGSLSRSDLRIELDEAFPSVPHVSRASGNNEWYTPPQYIAAARAVMGGIDLDPASSDKANETVKATKYYTLEDDGLTKEWKGRVWMNPPYAQPEILYFAAMLQDSFEKRLVSEACVLVNNATETKWFNLILAHASAICLIKGRVKFIDQYGKPSAAPLQGQVIIYLGNNAKLFRDSFSGFGKVLYV